MLLGFRPSELIVNSFKPYLNPIAVVNVNGCISKHNGTSFWLKYDYHNSIRSNDVELKCSNFIAFIFFSFDKINIILLVGNTAISWIYLINNIHPKIDWIGDLNVYTNVSWSNILKIIGNTFPGFCKWFCKFILCYY